MFKKCIDTTPVFMGITLYCVLIQETKSSLLHTVAASLKGITSLKKAGNCKGRTNRQFTEQNLGGGGARGSDLAKKRFLLPGIVLFYNTTLLAPFHLSDFRSSVIPPKNLIDTIISPSLPDIPYQLLQFVSSDHLMIAKIILFFFATCLLHALPLWKRRLKFYVFYSSICLKKIQDETTQEL